MTARSGARVHLAAIERVVSTGSTDAEAEADRNRLWAGVRRSIDFTHDRDAAALVHDDAAAAGRRRTGQARAGGSRGQVGEAVGGGPDLRVRPDEVAGGDLRDRH